MIPALHSRVIAERNLSLSRGGASFHREQGDVFFCHMPLKLMFTP
jgi:hypothetical protein